MKTLSTRYAISETLIGVLANANFGLLESKAFVRLGGKRFARFHSFLRYNLGAKNAKWQEIQSRALKIEKR